MNVLEIFGVIFIVQIGLMCTVFTLSTVLSVVKYNSEKIKNRYVEELTKKIKVGDFDISNTDNIKDDKNLQNFEKKVEQMENEKKKELEGERVSKEAFQKALDETKKEIDEKV